MERSGRLCSHDAACTACDDDQKDAFSKGGGYRQLHAPAEDIDHWLRIAGRHELANLRDVMIRYRVHPSQPTGRECEVPPLFSRATRARAEGRPYSIDVLHRIDREAVRRIRATEQELAAAVVEKMTWVVAKTFGRAAYAAEAERLFLDAHRRARAEHSFSELAVRVDQRHARPHWKEGRRLPFALESLRAARAELAARASGRR